MKGNNADIVVFACNWDGLSCVEAAAQKRLNYPSSVKLIRVNCLSRVHSGLILKAFELGADGVMLLGCQPESCYEKDEKFNDKEYEKALSLLSLLGLGTNRLKLTRLPRGDGDAFVNQVESFIDEVSRAE
jgi:coenzyme F420-reducing hydrogenase delta subunit